MAVAAQPQMAVVPAEFHNESKVKRTRIQLLGNGFAEGKKSRWQLQNSGLANEIYGTIFIPFEVVGTVTGGRFAGWNDVQVSNPPSLNPAPFSVLRNITFSNTGSYTFHDEDGFCWYSWLRDRYAYDWMSSYVDAAFSDDVKTNILGSNTMPGAVLPGADVVEQSYVIAIPFRLPLSYNHAGDRCLIVLSTTNLYYNLDIEWGTIATGIGATGGSSDLIKGLTGTDLEINVGTPYINMELEYFLTPPEFAGRLDMFINEYMAVQQEQQPINNTGVQTYLPPPLALYTGVGIHVYNNGRPVPAANVTDIEWNYGGQTNDIDDDLISMQARQAMLSQSVPMDGKIFFDYGVELGLYQKRDRFGAFNNQAVSGLNVQYRIDNSVSLVNAQSVMITEAIMPFRQSA